MFESIELTFFRKITHLVACVLLPGFIYGVLLSLGQDRPQLDVSHQVARVVILQDTDGFPNAFFLNRPGQFDQCVRERGRKFCLGLLSEKIAGALPGESGAVPNATESAGHGGNSSYEGAPDGLAHWRILSAGLMGIVGALVCMAEGTQLRRISAA